jgi:hypothetical protein
MQVLQRSRIRRPLYVVVWKPAPVGRLQAYQSFFLSFLTCGAFGLQCRLALESRLPQIASTGSKKRSFLPSHSAVFPDSQPCHKSTHERLIGSIGSSLTAIQVVRTWQGPGHLCSRRSTPDRCHGSHSAFDFILGSGIPEKGKVLTQISLFWFEMMKDIIPIT